MRLEALTALAASAETPEQFLEQALRALTLGLGYDIAAVGELHDDARCITTLAAVDGDTLMPTMRYELAGTPCERIYNEHRPLFIAENVGALFPEDLDLQTLEAEAYRGELLTDRQGRPFGHVFAIHRQPVTDSEDDAAFFHLVSQRIGAELLRWRAEERLKIEEQRARDFAECSSDWFWETNADHSLRTVSPARGRLDRQANLADGRWFLQRLLSGDGVSGDWARVRAAVRAREPFRDFKVSLTGPDGGAVHLCLSGRPIFDSRGDFTGYRGVGSDLTPQQEAIRAAALADTRLALAFDSLSAHIVVFDADEGLVLCNRAYRERNRQIAHLLTPGRSFEEILRALADADALAGVGNDKEAWIRRRLERFRRPQGAFDIWRSDGSWFRVVETRAPDGGTVSVGADITDLKLAEEEAEENRRRFEDYASISADWFWEQDADLRFRHIASPRALELGFEAQEHVGKTRWETGAEVSELARREHDEILALRLPFDDFRYTRTFKNGRRAHLSVSGRPRFDQDGRFLGYRGVGRDVTDIVASQEALRAEHWRAEQVSRAKSEFLAHLSHEFRTPLNAIIGFSELIEGELFGPVGNTRYRDYSSDILASARHLLKAIDQIADLNEVEFGDFEPRFEDVDLAAFLNDLLRESSVLKSAPSLTVEVHLAENNLYVCADRGALWRIVECLLSNAVKYGRSGGRIDIRVSEEGEEIGLEIADDGHGFEPAQIERALAPFGRLRSPMVRQSDGLGLGLTLVNSLVKRHDAHFSVESVPGRGTRARLLFRGGRCENARASAPSARREATT